MLRCRDIYEFLDAYIERTLPFLVRVKFALHLLRCAACRAYLATYLKTREIVVRSSVSNDLGEPPEELIQAILGSRETMTEERSSES